jgi:hypothetical protein
LGPLLCAIFVSSLFDLNKIKNVADYNFIVLWNKLLSNLIVNPEKELEITVKCRKDSGLMVNSGKLVICLFHRNDQPNIIVDVSGVQSK